MLGKKHLLITLLFLFISSAIVFAQDGEKVKDTAKDAKEKTEKKVKEKKEKVVKEKAEKTEKVKGEKGDDEYPYPSFRDEEYKDFVAKRRQDQQDKFLDNKYTHPARPKDKWEIGITVGSLLVSGDIHGNSPFKWKASGNMIPKIGIGGHVRKSLGYIFSIRGNFMMGSTWGRNWEKTQGWAESSISSDPNHIPNVSLAGSIGGLASQRYDELNDGRTPDYTYIASDGTREGRAIFYNYKTNIREASISGIVNIHNIRFHKRQTCVDLYGLIGIGGLAYRTFQDQLNGDNEEYDVEAYASVDLYEERKDRLDQLDQMYDGDFESQAERHWDDWSPFDNYSFKPTAHVGLGLAFKISRIVNIGLESRVTYTNDDLLDGQRWQEWGALTRDYDTYVYTGVHANFNIGRKNSVEPLWWMNPLDYAYSELNEAPCCDDLPEWPDLNDDDKDGVPNIFDEEPDSREDCPVDTRGRMLDSDRDGVLDCDDKEPHTRYDMIGEVDQYGVAPPMTCKDLAGDICDCARKCMPPPPPVTSCCDRVLPNILFDLNKYSVMSQFEPQIAEIARFLNDPQCSNDRLAIVGHTDARGGNDYNNVLSYKRAQEVVNKLVSSYGVPAHKLVIRYGGETSPTIGGLSTVGQKGIDADHALNRRVEVRCAMPGEMSMPMPAGPSNAGSRKPQPRP